MLNINNINSLTDFTRNAREHINRLKETGEPEVLTVNGRAELVVQDAEAYQKMLDALDYADSVAKIGKALERLRNGDEGIPMRDALESIAKQAGIELKKK